MEPDKLVLFYLYLVLFTTNLSEDGAGYSLIRGKIYAQKKITLLYYFYLIRLDCKETV